MQHLLLEYKYVRLANKHCNILQIYIKLDLILRIWPDYLAQSNQFVCILYCSTGDYLQHIYMIKNCGIQTLIMNVQTMK